MCNVAKSEGGLSNRLDARLYEDDDGDGDGVLGTLYAAAEPSCEGDGPAEEAYNVVSSVILSISHFLR